MKESLDHTGSPVKSQIRTLALSPGRNALSKYGASTTEEPISHRSKVYELTPISEDEVAKIEPPNDEVAESVIDDDHLCIICFTNPQNCVNMPCGHGSLCIDCSLEIMEKSDTCCICRELVEQILEVDMKDSHKRNNCWRVKKCFVFFEEGTSEPESEEEDSDDSSGINADPVDEPNRVEVDIEADFNQENGNEGIGEGI